MMGFDFPLGEMVRRENGWFFVEADRSISMKG